MSTGMQRTPRWNRLAACVAVGAVAAACATDSPPDEGAAVDSAVVSVAAFATTEPGWTATIGELETETDWPGVEVDYGPSADLVRELSDGKGVDIVHLAATPDMDDLARADLVPPYWDNGTAGGFPFSSVVTLVVRAGNPRGVRDWPDLLQPGLEVITPNPKNVGSGRWALLAAYAAASNGNQDPQAGEDYLRRLILEHIALGPATVMQARDEFINGRGDVLLISEAGALQLESDGSAVEQVSPRQTLRMDFPVAVTSRGLGKPPATRLVEFMFSPNGQTLWAEAGFRPRSPVPGVTQEQFPTPERLWTISDLGGWDIVEPRYFHPKRGIITSLFTAATEG
ncbi:MAG: substrate-binding domain-containing protein [Mycobacterium sp.]